MVSLPKGFAGNLDELLQDYKILNTRFRLALMYFSGEESLAGGGDGSVDDNVALGLFYNLSDDYSETFSKFESLVSSLDSVKLSGEGDSLSGFAAGSPLHASIANARELEGEGSSLPG